MSYEPKRPQKIDVKKALIVGVSLCVLMVFAFQHFQSKSEDKERFKVCGMSGDETQQALEKKAKDTYPINDYYFYGETLNILRDPYNPAVSDPVYGKSILLKDMCSQEEYAFVVGSTIDSSIVLNNVKEGFYRVYVVEDLIEKQVVMGLDVHTSMKSISRAGARTKVSLLAKPAYFQEKDVKVAENYMYLDVKNTTLAKDEYDIAIDPAGRDYDFTQTLNKGSEGHGLVEMEESYKAAQLLAQKLEERGLKVLIVRGAQEDVNSYGIDGRLERAYRARAKYYIRLGFSQSNNNYEGMDIMYSAHSSDMFANQIMYYVKRNSDVAISKVYSLERNDGYYPATLLEGMDARGVYDSDLWIREAGGKATMAGMYSQNAVEGTSSFAKDSMFGMNALNINLGYLSHAKDVAYWTQNQESYMDVLAKAIKNYLNTDI